MSVAAAVICGDARDGERIKSFLAGRKVNVVITSPPYASQRAYDPSSGFVPIAPDKYVEWYRDIQSVIADILAPDGSYFLNIKEHADEGQRSLYVKDLTLAHVRQWGWRFVDEFCWRKTDNGVPGGWNNRFKNAWEPVFHFCRRQQIKFRPQAVGHKSDGCFNYSPDTPRSNSGSGLIGDHTDDKIDGIARPSNVIEVKSESSQGSHSAPFPRALVEFFIKAFSDPGDVIFDPFGGSGTTVAAAVMLGRNGVCTELSPAYCDVIVRRIEALNVGKFARVSDGCAFEDVAVARSVVLEAVKR